MLGHVFLLGKIVAVIFRQTWAQLRLQWISRIHRWTYSPGSRPKNIVVVGASFAGYHAARCLANSVPSGYRVVVIEKNSHFQLTWVLPRFCVVNGHDNKAFIPYGHYIQAPEGSCSWVKDTVKAVLPNSDSATGGRVQLASGEYIAYEYLVLATGASASLPSRVSQTDKINGMEAIGKQRQALERAQDIVIVGGGAAGIELAADAKVQFPQKNVTLIHSGRTLLHKGFGVKIQHSIRQEIEALGVTLVLGERPALPDDATTSGVITLAGGEVIHFDCLIKCIGQKPNSKLLHFLSPGAFTASGHIRVKPSLAVEDDSFHHIYAAGDVIDTGAAKNGRSAIEQGSYVARNIVCAIEGQPQIQYEPEWWESSTKLTLGLNKGIIYTSDGRTEWVISSGKPKIELDSPRVWKYFGATPYVDQ
ncbi:hypothetical protein N7462_004188 [Penicillium macrosclerotiorum]|uniref:uncharacterized protein n=1 Tax=Penicillium macrosclerotiorum TaxID=303699 RepID=UPI00254734F1|nr:uncharacterized protein N7462_004188 [Penicillium macrosclerotiorum]KAJ5689796.1 hypothetical protein N7462_004188 [Penicillium macrosclerotiorum]